MQRNRHLVLLLERLPVAQDAVVPRRRLDREADGFEPADELADVLPHLRVWGEGIDLSVDVSLAQCHVRG